MKGSDFARRVDLRLTELNKSRKELCYQCELASNSVSMWSVRNTIPSADKAVRIARFLSTSVEYLVTGSNSPAPDIATADKSDFYVPFYEQKLSAGYGEPVIDEAPEDKRLWIRAPGYLRNFSGKLVAVQVKGTSMRPKFSDGDIVIIDTLGYSGDDYYAISMDGDCFIKRITRKPSTVVIASVNPDFPTWEVPLQSDTVKIIGRVRCALVRNV